MPHENQFKFGSFLVLQKKNEVLARLMDAGKLIFGKLEAKEWIDDWLKLDVRVFMRDY